MFKANEHSHMEFEVNASTGMVIRTLRQRKSSSNAATTETISLEIDYSPQDIQSPSPGDPSMETDPDKIAAFLELFD